MVAVRVKGFYENHDSSPSKEPQQDPASVEQGSSYLQDPLP